jgi:hypothetical protein
LLGILLSLLPWATEAILEWLIGLRGIPLSLILTVVECAAVLVFYGYAITWQGALLQMREQKILDIIAPKTE